MAKNNSFSLPGAKNLPNEISATTFQQLLKRKNAGTFIPDAKKMLYPREETLQIFPTPHPDEGIFIPGSVPSKKRAYKPVIVRSKGRGGNPHMSLAKQDHVVDYERRSAEHWIRFAPEFRELIGVERPVYVQMFFIRSTEASRWDFNNLSQMVCDMMVQYSWIDDDNIDNLIAVPPFDMPKWIKDKNNPGVLIKKLNIKIIDDAALRIIKHDEEDLARLTEFISYKHPNITGLYGSNCVDVAIKELKAKWGIQ